MKITVIGAGSTYMPELVEGLLQRLNVIPTTHLALMDIDAAKLDIVGGLARRMVAKQGNQFEVTLTTNRIDAIRDAAFVLTQIRVGRLAARERDELIPRSLGYIGQETTGPGGFFKALRTIPVILDIARDMEAHARGAFLINFTNPAGIVTEAVLSQTGVPVVGLCNGPFGTLKLISQVLDVPESELSMRYFGLNHLSFADNISHLGHDVHDKVVEALASQADDTDAAILRGLRLIPSGYLQYFYKGPEKLAEEQAETKSRAQQVMEIEDELLRLYQDPGLAEKPAILEQRGGAWYSTVAAKLIASIVSNKGDVHIVNTRNRGAIADLPFDCAVEVAASVDARGATALVQGPLPLKVRGLVQQVKAYEQLTVQAAITGDRETAVWALTNNPLVGSYTAAGKLFDALAEAHKEYLPAFF
jgi:6-phospho-beta-glucosidase